MRKLGLDPTETDKVYSLSGTGGFYRRSDAKALHEMFNRHSREMKEAIAADKTGNGFIYDMFCYELANHEYCITYDVSDTIEALGLTMDKIKSDPKMLKALERAKKAQFEE